MTFPPRVPKETEPAGRRIRPIDDFARPEFDAHKFIADFDLFALAAGGVGKLRQLVMSLAMRGRLTQQLSTDGHADQLLAAVTEGTAANGKLSSGKLEQAQAPEPFPLPPSWRWARFDRVASIASHLVDPARFPDHPHVAPDNIEKATGRLLEYRTVQEDGVTSSKHRFFPGQIVYSKIRPNLSKAALVDFEGLCSADMYPLAAKIDRAFLHYYLLSPVFLEQVVRDDNRLAMPKVNQEQLAAVLVAVPPMAEQKRIVAKVDQLMALCDDLEVRQTKKREIGTRLTESALEALTTAASPGEFDVAWKRVVDNFALIFPTAASVSDLRNVILSLPSVEGWCSPTLPTSRPLSYSRAWNELGRDGSARTCSLMCRPTASAISKQVDVAAARATLPRLSAV
ncbi:MAG: restriction endonuclease subunit S [Kofleriaceae bacterium]